jgi:5-methylcytosine-specific restriction endonuclease McrA
MIARTTEMMAIKESVRKRDGYKCVDCGMTQGEVSRIKSAERWDRWRTHINPHAVQTYSLLFKLDVHRLVPGGPYALENCVTVCRKCHARRHREMSNYQKPWVRKKLRKALCEYAGLPVPPGACMAKLWQGESAVPA